MSHLFAKLKKDNHCKWLCKEENVFPLLQENIQVTPYNNDYTLKESEWFIIEHFEKNGYGIEIINKNTNLFNLEKANITYLNDVSKVSYLCWVTNEENDFYFQRVRSNKIIIGKAFCIGDNFKVDNIENVILLSEIPDAVYKKNEDILYFKKLSSITPIFPKTRDLKKEATEKDARDFSNIPNIQLSPNLTFDKLSDENKTLIPDAIEIMQSLTNNQKISLFSYIQKYKPNLNFDGTDFTILENDELTDLLYGIKKRYFSSPLDDHEHYLATSVKKIN